MPFAELTKLSQRADMRALQETTIYHLEPNVKDAPGGLTRLPGGGVAEKQIDNGQRDSLRRQRAGERP